MVMRNGFYCHKCSKFGQVPHGYIVPTIHGQPHHPSCFLEVYEKYRDDEHNRKIDERNKPRNISKK